MKVLDGKVVIVTGAGRGIGWGISRALGMAGSKVCISDINDIRSNCWQHCRNKESL